MMKITYLIPFLFFLAESVYAAPDVLTSSNPPVEQLNQPGNSVTITPLPRGATSITHSEGEVLSRTQPANAASAEPVIEHLPQKIQVVPESERQSSLAVPPGAQPVPVGISETAMPAIQHRVNKTSALPKKQAQPVPVSVAPQKTPQEKPKETVQKTPQETRQEQEMAAYGQAINDYIKAQQSGDAAKALQILKPLWPEIVKYGDYGTMVALAYIAMQEGDEATALKAAQTAADDTEDDQFYQVFVEVLLHFKHASRAEEVLQKMSPSEKRDQMLAQIAVAKAQNAYNDGLYPDAENLLLKTKPSLNADGLELLGWTEYRLGKLQESNQAFADSYAKKPSLGAAQGLVFSANRLHQYPALLAISQQNPGPLDDLLPEEVREKIQSGWTKFSVNSDAKLAVLKGGSSASGVDTGWTARIEPTYRDKKGTPGEGRLTQTGVGGTLTWRGQQDEIQLNAEQQRVDDKQTAFNGQNFYALWKHYGENNWNYRLGIGRSQSGGPIAATLLGEAGLGYYAADFGLGLRLFRKSNEESSLAYIGKINPQLPHQAWGRVIENGVSVDTYKNWQDWNGLISLTAARLNGDGVAANTKFDVYARGLHPIANVSRLQLGPELYASHFNRNLSAFEPGHGGYFSPNRFMKLGGVAAYRANINQWNIDLLAGFGYGWSDQAAADGNPITGAEPNKYPASRSQGIAYQGQMEMTYPLAHEWLMGFSFGGQRSPDYTDWHTGLFVQRHWRQ